jgi:hypothetical protein
LTGGKRAGFFYLNGRQKKRESSREDQPIGIVLNG